MKAEANLLKSISGSTYDAICIVDGYLQSAGDHLSRGFAAQRSLDAAFDSEVSCFRVDGIETRIIYAPVGTLDDYDDVRVYERAVGRALARAVKV